MQKSRAFIKQKLRLLMVVAVATIIGGLSSAVVFASIPDSNGQINACYKNSTGALSVTDPAGNCPGNSTPLSWSQNGQGGGSSGGSPVVEDGNGQVLGNITAPPSTGELSIFNQSLKRTFNLVFSGATQNFILGNTQRAVFTSSNCTGQMYGVNTPDIKLELDRVNSNTYAVVGDSAQPQSLTYNSRLDYDGATDTFSCTVVPSTTDNLYVLTPVNLPFSFPVATPFIFQ